MKRRPTIIDVARLAGVSKTTVSRVISDDSSVRDETRRRVQTAIETLGYEQNVIASSLRTDRTNIIMLAIPDITNPFWPDVARGVQDVMDREGYAVVFANSDWNLRQERLFLQMARRNRFDGILINPVGVSNSELSSTEIPTVLLGSNENYPDFDTVGSDSFGGTRLALEHLASLGHRRIGLIRGHRVNRPGHSRLAGYLAFLYSRGIARDDSLIVEAAFDQAGGYEAMQQLLDLSQPPTAVFAANDILAIGALQAVQQAGKHVPQDISIVGMDDIFAASTTTPSLTTVAKPKRENGQQAAILLLDRIRDNGLNAARRHISPCRLTVRGSTGPPLQDTCYSESDNLSGICSGASW